MFSNVLQVQAGDSECMPPYSNYVGSFSSESSCEAEARVCTQSGTNWYGYDSSKVGDSCTLVATGNEGTCNTIGECILTGECDTGWRWDDWTPLESEKNCGRSFTQTRDVWDAANCGTDEGKLAESQRAVGTSCSEGKICENQRCVVVSSGGTTPSPRDTSPGTTYTSEPGVIQNPLGYENFEDLVNAIINFLWIIATPLAAIMFVISGVMFVTSAGSPERVKTARNVALYTAIGYGIIIIASGLIKVLQSLLQGS